MECENHFYLYVLMCMACWRFGKAEGASDRACYACACVRVCAHIRERCKQAGGTRGAIDVMSRSWFPARRLTWARPIYKYHSTEQGSLEFGGQRISQPWYVVMPRLISRLTCCWYIVVLLMSLARGWCAAPRVRPNPGCRAPAAVANSSLS